MDSETLRRFQALESRVEYLEKILRASLARMDPLEKAILLSKATEQTIIDNAEKVENGL